MEVLLGNPNPVDGSGPSVTHVSIPDGVSVEEVMITITDPRGLWAVHGTEPPSWVASDDKALEKRLAEFYECRRGAPKGAK